MFRCGHYFTGAASITRALHTTGQVKILNNGLQKISTRCLSTTTPRYHWRESQELGGRQKPLHNDSGPVLFSIQGSRRGYKDQKAGGGVNLTALFGVGVSVIIGGILFMSSATVTDDLKPKKDAPKGEKTKKSDEEQTAPPASEPEVEPPKFPEQVTYLIIGAGTAAMTATKTIRKNDPTAKVLMVTDEKYRPYMRPPLSKELWFEGSDAEKLTFKDWAGKSKDVFYQPEEFYLQPELLSAEENGGTAIAYQKKVAQLDVSEQTAHFEDGGSIKYDKCLLATGGIPRSLPMFDQVDSKGKEKIHLYRNIEDFHRLDKAVGGSKSVAVVGGGFLGSELAVALAQKAKNRDLKVYQTFPENGNMGLVFPEYLSLWTMDKMKKEGIEVYPGTFTVGCTYNEKTNQIDLSLQNGEKLSCDQVVVAVGLQPNIELARTSGLEVDNQHGGFLVNAELEARKNLWVAGDAACFYDISLGRRRVEHHDHAVVSGRLAGDNMTGKGKPYWHQSMFWSDLGPSIGYEAIGICDSRLPTFAVFAKASEQDTPKAVVEKTGEGLRSETETESESSPVEAPVEESQPPEEVEDYGKGVVFYTRDDKIVGMVLWNLFGRMPIARQVLKEGRTAEDLNEVAKLFNVHDLKQSKE